MQNLIRPTLFVAMTLAGALAQAGDLTIRVDNVKDAHGTVRVAMFDTADGFLKRPLREEAVAANPGGTVVVFKNLPAGDYATLTYHGAPSGLVGATAVLLEWGAREDVRWDVQPTAAGERWGVRLEIYRTDPAAEPDPDRWETELAFKLA